MTLMTELMVSIIN